MTLYLECWRGKGGFYIRAPGIRQRWCATFDAAAQEGLTLLGGPFEWRFIHPPS